jgi:prepilin-type N-terminal cleavage/methylation domain-containing protein
MNRRGFTLIELIVATVLSAVLIGGMLTAMAGVARDRRRLAAAQTAPDVSPVLARVGWDLAQADTFASAEDGRSLVLFGHGAIDRRNLVPTGRLARVTYRIVGDARHGTCLVREQQLLDDPALPPPWRELVATGTTALHVVGPAAEAPDGRRAPGSARPVPARVTLTIEQGGMAVRKEVFAK